MRRYAEHIHHELGVIAHPCGVPEPRRLRRYHCRTVTADGRSVPFDELYPPVEPPRAVAAQRVDRGDA